MSIKHKRVTLGEIVATDGIQTGPFGSQLKAEEYSLSGVPVVMPKDIFRGHLTTKSIARITEEKAATLEKHFILPGDLIFPRRGNLRRIGVAVEENRGWLCGSGCLRARLNGTVNSGFLHQYVQLDSVGQWLERQALGQTMLNLNSETVASLPIVLPPLAEQKAIAELLSIWDAAIEKTEQLIQAKEQKFKWLIQALIREPRMGTDNHGWKKVKLGEAGIPYSGLTGKTKDDFGTGKPYIPYLNIYSNYQINPLHLDYVNISEGEIQNPVQRGDVFFTVSSETPDEVGIASVLLMDIGECYLNSFCLGWRPISNHIVPGFLQFYFRSNKFRKQMYRLAQGGTRFNLSRTELMKVALSLPPIDDQRKISAILSDARQEIDTLKQLSQSYRTQMRGLMQKVLTGVWRLKPKIVKEYEEV